MDLEDVDKNLKVAPLKFQGVMYNLKDLFAYPDVMEFLIVAIRMKLALRESVQLMNNLLFGNPDMDIHVRNMVVNQVLEENGDDIEEDKRLWGFVMRHVRLQVSSVKDMWRAVNGMNNLSHATRVNVLDT